MAGRIFNVEDPHNDAPGSAGLVGNTISPPTHAALVSAGSVGNTVSLPHHAALVPAVMDSQPSTSFQRKTGKTKLTRVPQCPPGSAGPGLASTRMSTAISEKVVSSGQVVRKNKLTLGTRRQSSPGPTLVVPPCKYLQI